MHRSSLGEAEGEAKVACRPITWPVLTQQAGRRFLGIFFFHAFWRALTPPIHIPRLSRDAQNSESNAFAMFAIRSTDSVVRSSTDCLRLLRHPQQCTAPSFSDEGLEQLTPKERQREADLEHSRLQGPPQPTGACGHSSPPSITKDPCGCLIQIVPEKSLEAWRVAAGDNTDLFRAAFTATSAP